ncbi:hypothetical protein C7437_102408 [Psychrobacillus insolitus]|uniref:Glycosyltransferase involved in cell wall biosynthesis n=1 Tax=Psychrobacillus insolitus TaxID=1461 RepID=A0A2W7MII0_9BACI|nr:hypothetical protein [Psychrobacillus insolitus]PZX05941.1 hypothetical protein C7437_102408 [Psychrobacillus insolitus]
MKVLVLGFTKISYMPYMHFYLEQLKNNNCEIHLLYWKRDSNPDSESPDGIVTHVFERYQEDTVPLRNKIGSFLGYRKYALQILRNNDFDLIVVLHSTPGVLLFDVLSKKYKEKYILDYRDFTYENIKIYRKIIHKLVNGSVATFVSSDAYRKNLPQGNRLYTSHNIIMKSIENKEIRRLKSRDSKPIIIRFWGFIRHETINIEIIRRLANDKRFELHYHGREQKTGEILKDFCGKNKVENVYFHGEYKPDDRFSFIKNTDLIHNIYENDIKTINAMGNKYYDGTTFYLPQITNKGSFMGEQVSRNGIGIMLDPNSLNFADEIWDYYKSINWDTFNTSCDDTLNNIIMQYNDGVNMIEKIIIDGKKDN